MLLHIHFYTLKITEKKEELNFVMIIFQQRNLKQRFIALLKRFKVPEAFEQDQELDPRTGKYF